MIPAEVGCFQASTEWLLMVCFLNFVVAATAVGGHEPIYEEQWSEI